MALSRPLPNMKLEGSASTNQANCKFGPFAGSQCLSICVYYLASSYHDGGRPVADREKLDAVLLGGSDIDRLLRNGRHIPKNQFAQLSNIPSAISTHLWECGVQTSTEIFGLLGEESATDASFIMSLSRLLERNYFDITQYILYICQGKSGAIIIKNGTFFIFDPHCIAGRGNTPASVLSSKRSTDIVKYIGPVQSEYTACHLYFTPLGCDARAVKEFLLSNYGIHSHLKRKGPMVDLRAMRVIDTTTTAPCPRPLLPGSRQPSFSFGTCGPASGSVFRFSADQTAAALPGSSELVEAMKGVSKRKRGAASPTQAQGDAFHISKKSTPTKSQKNLESEDLAIKAFWIDDNISAAGGQDSEVEGSVSSSDEYEELGAGTEDQLTAASSSDTDRNSTTSPLDVSGNSSNPDHGPDYYRLDFSEHDDLQMRFTRLENQIQALKAHPPHAHGHPTLTDSGTGRPYKEAAALYLIDRLIANVVIEQGMVSTDLHQHQALNLLRFLIIWSEKLSVPTDQLHVLLKTGLNIGKVHAAIACNKIEAGNLKDILTAKLNLCLERIHENTNGEIAALIKRLSTGVRDAQVATTARSPDEEIRQILDATPGTHLVLTSNEASEVRRLTRTLKEKIAAKNTEISNENATFEKILASMKNYFPVPSDTGPVDYDLPQKASKVGELVSALSDSLTEEAESTGQNMLLGLKQKDTLTLDIPDFHGLLAKITTTVNSIKVCTDNMKLSDDGIARGLQQLLYLGGEISTLTNSKWTMPTPDAVRKLAIFEDIRNATQAVKEEDQKHQALNTILDDIEAMLEASKTDADHGQYQKLALSMPVIESYLANAGALVGPGGDKRFDVLMEQIQALYRSKNVVIAIISNISVSSLVTEVQQLALLLKDGGVLAQSDVQDAIDKKLQELFHDIGSMLKKKNLEALTSSQLAALEALANLAEDKSKAAVASFYARVADALAHGSEDSELRASLKIIKGELATANISNLHKRNLYKIITCLNKLLKSDRPDSLEGGGSKCPPPPPSGEEARASSKQQPAEPSAQAKKGDSKPRSGHLKKTHSSSPGPDKHSAETPQGPRRPRSTPEKKHNRQTIRVANPTTPPASPKESSDSDELMDTTTARANDNAPADLSFPKTTDSGEAPAQERMDTLDTDESSNLFCEGCSDATMDVDSAWDLSYFPSGRKGSGSQDNGQQSQTSGKSHGTAVRGIIQNELEKAAEHAWKKIQSSFKNLDFASISAADWEYVASEYDKSDSKIMETLGTTLQKLMTQLLERLTEMVLDAALGLTKYMAKFQWPKKDWITPYHENVIFYLKTISFPAIAELACQTEVEIQVLWQIMHSQDLAEATAGTYLEQDGRHLTQIVSSIEDAASEYKISVTTEVNNWTHALKHDASLTSMPQKPDIIVPKKLMDPKLEQLASGLRPKFKQCALGAESSLLADITNEFQLLKYAAEEAAEGFNRNQEDAYDAIRRTLEEAKTGAPTAVSLRPVPEKDPLSFLSGLIRDAELVSKPLYRETQEVLDWADSACARVMVKCPAFLKQRVSSLFADITRVRADNKAMVLLEEDARQTDDIDVLKKAVTTLDPKRIDGGQGKIQEWNKKIASLEKMLAMAELEMSVLDGLASIGHLAVSSRSQSALTSLKHKAAALQARWQKERQASNDETVNGKLEELSHFILFKTKFLDFYESQQSFIFSNFPLSQANAAQATPGEAGPETERLGGSRDLDTINYRLRLTALCSLSSSVTAKTWIETFPTVDALTSDFLPAKKGAPLSLQVVFNNFLETHFVQTSEEAKAEQATDRLGETEQHLSLLPGMASGYQGLLINRLLETQWGEITRHAKEALETYTTISGQVTQSIKQNEFMAMVLTVHGCLLSLPQTESPHTASNDSTIAISLKNTLKAVLWLWPGVIYYFLRMPSFQEGVGFLVQLQSRCIDSMSRVFLLQHVAGIDFPTDVPIPSSYFFCPRFWKPVELEEYMWKQKDFVMFCGNSEPRARACFLAWALKCINPVVVDQLWSSLKPLFLKDVTTPTCLLNLLVDAAYKRPKTFKVNEAAKGDESEPYEYGLAGQTVLVVADTIPAPQGGPQVPTTAFELALAAVLRKLHASFYLTDDESFCKHDSIGEVHLVSRLLDCSEYSEPFASLLKAPLSPATKNQALENAYTRLERDVFYSQASWMQAFGQLSSTAQHLEFPIVLLNSENKVLGAYHYTEQLATKFPGARFQYDGQGLPQWPLESLTLSSLTQEKLADTNQVEQWVGEIDRKTAACPADSFFSTYPLELLKRETDQSSPESSSVSQPPSFQPPSAPHKNPSMNTPSRHPSSQHQISSNCHSDGHGACINNPPPTHPAATRFAAQGNPPKPGTLNHLGGARAKPASQAKAAVITSKAPVPLPTGLSRLPLIAADTQAGNLWPEPASCHSAYKIIVPPLTVPIELRSQGCGQQVQIGKVKVIAPQHIFATTPNKQQATSSPLKLLIDPAFGRSCTSSCSHKPPQSSASKPKAPSISRGGPQKLKVIQEEVPSPLQTPILPVTYEFSRLCLTKRAPQETFQPAQASPATNYPQKGGQKDINGRTRHLNSDSLLPALAPTIKTNYLTIQEIINNRAALVAPRLPVIPLEQNLDPHPLFKAFLAETNINEAKVVLLQFIDQIKKRLLDSTKNLMLSINKIKALYL